MIKNKIKSNENFTGIKAEVAAMLKDMTSGGDNPKFTNMGDNNKRKEESEWDSAFLLFSLIIFFLSSF